MSDKENKNYYNYFFNCQQETLTYGQPVTPPRNTEGYRYLTGNYQFHYVGYNFLHSSLGFTIGNVPPSEPVYDEINLEGIV